MEVVYRCCCGIDVHKKIISFNRDRKIHGYLKRLKALGWEPDALPGSA